MTGEEDIAEVESQVRSLATAIKTSDGSGAWMTLERQIAEAIIDYSIRQNIVIPLIDYEKYNKKDDPLPEDTGERVLIRKQKLDDSVDNPDEYDFVRDFHDALLEKHSKVPRFELHPDILYLASCWDDVIFDDD